MALIVIVFAGCGFCFRTDQSGFDEIASTPIFHFRYQLRRQRRREIFCGGDELGRLQKKDIALLEASGQDQASLDFYRKLS